MWSNDKSKGTSEKEQSVYARICLLEARQMELLPPQLNEGNANKRNAVVVSTDNESKPLSNAASSSRGMKKNYLKGNEGKLPGSMISVLKNWYEPHSKWPYPTVSLSPN
ncbi:hypothetical protein H5410_026462 [Solanum commersonii]|uniref:Uncharacterized protein n=1 Tax=Solanum commersonii TaxID=4109 RepID=A0A9J5YX49_SOLCO|nr:hypothetical protein H5410_026462 [Solanum commersonii]